MHNFICWIFWEKRVGFFRILDTSGQLRKTSIGRFDAEKLAVTGRKKLIISKGKVFRADRKKLQQLYLQHYFGDHKDLYISSLFYFNFVIDNAKPTYLDGVNSNICSCIFSLLKFQGTFCFMN